MVKRFPRAVGRLPPAPEPSRQEAGGGGERGKMVIFEAGRAIHRLYRRHRLRPGVDVLEEPVNIMEQLGLIVLDDHHIGASALDDVLHDNPFREHGIDGDDSSLQDQLAQHALQALVRVRDVIRLPRRLPPSCLLPLPLDHYDDHVNQAGIEQSTDTDLAKRDDVRPAREIEGIHIR